MTTLNGLGPLQIPQQAPFSELPLQDGTSEKQGFAQRQDAISFGMNADNAIQFGALANDRQGSEALSAQQKTCDDSAQDTSLEKLLTDLIASITSLISGFLDKLKASNGSESGSADKQTPVGSGQTPGFSAQNNTPASGEPTPAKSSSDIKPGSSEAKADAGQAPQGMPQSLWEDCVKAGEKHGVDPYILAAQSKQETSFGADLSGSSGGDGVMQVEPGTRQAYADKFRQETGRDYDHGSQSDQVELAAVIMGSKGGDATNQLMKYNGGDNWAPGATDSYGREIDAQGYAEKVQQIADQLRGKAA
ncbi:hypothetical protein [Pseudomonas sp. LRF_L74]|uniref:hypothetical protein n=1 Tax=Pseudomonas sp. LRF_L74 TaxID=3369422 RepID=UPI003F5F5AE9